MGKIRTRVEKEEFAYQKYDSHTARPKVSRLDLNDLIKRSKLREKEEKQTNALIIGGAALLVFILSLFIFL